MPFLSHNRPIMMGLPVDSPLRSAKKARLKVGNLAARQRTRITTSGEDEKSIDGPLHVMSDMDHTLLHGQTLRDLLKRYPKYCTNSKIWVLVEALQVLRQQCRGRTSCNPAVLEAQLNQQMQQIGKAAEGFGKWRAWNAHITVPLPRVDGSVDERSYSMPMASACGGELVIVKLDVNIDRRIVNRNEQFKAALAAAVKAEQELSAAVKAEQELSAAVKAEQELSAAVKAEQEISAANKGEQELSAADKDEQKLSAADKDKQDPLVKCYYTDEWKDFIRRTDCNVEDHEHMYLVLHLAHDIKQLVDALFMLKLAVEAANGSPAEAAAAAGPEELQHFHLRLMTRNMRPSFAVAAMAAFDPDGRAFGPCQAENLVLCDLTRAAVAKGKYVTAANFKSERAMPAKKGVMVGLDDEIWQFDMHTRPMIDHHLTMTLLCDAYKENLTEHLGKSSGNVDMYLEVLSAAAQVIGLPDDLDLWEVIDPRSLQDRQTSTISRAASITYLLTQVQQTRAAAAAVAADQASKSTEPAATAPPQSPAPAAVAAAATDFPGSPIAIESMDQTPSPDQLPRQAAAGAADGEQQQQQQREDLKRDKPPTPSEESAEKERAAAKAAHTAERLLPSSSSSYPVSDLDRDHLAAAAAAADKHSAGGGAMVKPPAAFAAALQNEINNNPGTYDTVLAELQELQGAGQQQQQTSRLFAEYRNPNTAVGKRVRQHDTVIDLTYAVFGESIADVEAKVRGLSATGTINTLSKLDAVKTSLGPNFPSTWRLQLQQGKLQLIKIEVQFAVSTVWDEDSQQEVQRQFDISSPLFGRVPAAEWEAADRSSRQKALNIMLAATVRAILEGDSRLPAGMYLFKVDDEVRSQSGVTPSVAEKVAAAVDKMGKANVGGTGEAAAVAKH